MPDIRLEWSANKQAADLGQTTNDLASDAGLETAVIVSLFTDRRAGADDDIPDGTDDRRGWWADAYAQVADDKIGSRLWLLAREKNIEAAALKAGGYAREALAWMIEDGVVDRIDARAEAVNEKTLGLLVDIYRPAQATAQYRFEAFWNGA